MYIIYKGFSTFLPVVYMQTEMRKWFGNYMMLVSTPDCHALRAKDDLEFEATVPDCLLLVAHGDLGTRLT